MEYHPMRASLKFFLEKYKIKLSVCKKIAPLPKHRRMVQLAKERMSKCIPFLILLPYLSATLPICNFPVIFLLDMSSILVNNEL